MRVHSKSFSADYTVDAMVGTQTPRQMNATRLGCRLEGIGHFILRYGLVFILLMIGMEKWTKAEAEAIQPWIAHSPLLSWLYAVTTLQGASIFIGVCELVIAGLIFLRRWAPRLAAVGGAGAIFTFIVTLSFLLTTPNQGPEAQGFLIKDIFLLGAAVWSAGEALKAAATATSRPSGKDLEQL